MNIWQFFLIQMPLGIGLMTTAYGLYGLYRKFSKMSVFMVIGGAVVTLFFLAVYSVDDGPMTKEQAEHAAEVKRILGNN